MKGTLAKTVEAIPGRQGENLGKGTAKVVELEKEPLKLVETEQEITVYNLSDSVIPSHVHVWTIEDSEGKQLITTCEIP